MLFKSPTKPSVVTNVDANQLYRRQVSLSDWLPWVGHDEVSETFTLEDGFNAAVIFEITDVSTEARSEKFLQEAQANIQTCINHTISADDNPFVLQCFVSDEDSLSELAWSFDSYVEKHCRQTKEHSLLARNFVAHMQRHFKRMTRSSGLFEDATVTGGNWRDKVRRVRVFLYRRREANDHEHIDPVTEINQITERFVTQMVVSEIDARRCDDCDLYAWLLRWFNPMADVVQGDFDTLIDLLPMPEKKDKAFSHNLLDLLFLARQEPDKQHGVW